MKKITVPNKILNLLNTMGGFKPRDIIKATKLKPASVYTTLNVLRKQGKIAKEEDGVYISQTQTSTDVLEDALVKIKTHNSKVTAKKPKTTRNKDLEITIAYVDKLEAENMQYHNWCLQWREKHDKMEQALAVTESELHDAQAIIRYLEGRII